MHNLSTAELRKMLREQRKKTSAPSKMKKHELIAELEKHGIRSRSPSPEKPHHSPTPALPVKEKKVYSKKEQTPSAPPMKEEKVVKKEKKTTSSSAVVPASENVKKLVKGSQEARDRMAAIRAMRSSKKNVD